MKKKILIVVFIFFVLISLTYAEDRVNLNFSLSGGLSSPVGESGEQYWQPGFYLSGSLFYPITYGISLGGTVSYHKWTPDEDELLKEVAPYEEYFEVSGTATLIELVPSVRIDLVRGDGLKMFSQAGVGLCMMTLDAEVELNYLFLHLDESIKEERNRAMLVFGIGIDFGLKANMKVEALGLYHIVFIEDGRTEYISAGLGLSF